MRQGCQGSVAAGSHSEARTLRPNFTMHVDILYNAHYDLERCRANYL